MPIAFLLPALRGGGEPPGVQFRTAQQCLQEYARDMTVEIMKTSLAGAWIAMVIAVGLLVGARSTRSLVFLVAAAALPTLAMMLLWRAPTQTMSESIREGRR